MKPYQAFRLSRKFNIEKIYSVHYFEYSKSFSYKGEKHPFWELVYVDRGQVSVIADKKSYILSQGTAIFHMPDEYHNIRSCGDFANTVIISFDCNDNAMEFFKSKILTFDESEKTAISIIVDEASKAFSEPMNLVVQSSLKKRRGAPFACEQVIKNFIEYLLISLVRNNKGPTRAKYEIPFTGSALKASEIEEYLGQKISSSITLDEICSKFYCSKSYLKTFFKKSTGQSVIRYFNSLKIEEAKKLISNGDKSFTEISQQLGFGAIHYFSRMFKDYTNMTPTEYAKSVRSRGIL